MIASFQVFSFYDQTAKFSGLGLGNLTPQNKSSQSAFKFESPSYDVILHDDRVLVYQFIISYPKLRYFF